MVRPVLSLVFPIYNEEEVIPELHSQLQDLLKKLEGEAEVIFINDGSKDLSLQMLRGLVAAEPRYRVLSFSRNFGHQTAITAGIDHARGQAVVVMDADLQDPPEVVLEMVQKWREGYDVVYGQRAMRVGEPRLQLFAAKVVNRVFAAMIPIEVPLDTGDFRLMSRRVVVALRALRESHRFVRGLVSWVGFKQTSVLYDRPGRFTGRAKFSLGKMLRLAAAGITSFSVVPLRLATYLGFFVSFVSVLVALWATIAHFAFEATVPGWTAQVVIVSLLSSVQLVMIGILGEYIGRIYEQVKQRPPYLLGERVNLGEKDDDVLDEAPIAPVVDAKASVPPGMGTLFGMPAPSQPPVQTAAMPVLPAFPKPAPTPEPHAPISKTQPMSTVRQPTAEVPTMPQPSADVPTLRAEEDQTEITELDMRPSGAPTVPSTKVASPAKSVPPPLPKKKAKDPE